MFTRTFSLQQFVRTNRGVNFSFEIYDRKCREEKINLLNIKNLCDYYCLESFLSENKVQVNAKVLSNSRIYAENLKITYRKIQDKRNTKRGSEATEESRGKKTSQAGLTQQGKVFGPIVTDRIQRQQNLLSWCSVSHWNER